MHHESKTGGAKAKNMTPRHSVLMAGLPHELPTSEPSNTLHNGTTLIVGGEECLCYNDNYFQLVRSRFSIPANVVADIQTFNWANMRAGGGKGGDEMCFTSPDKKYIIKELGGDHETLLSITKSYVEHVCGDSLLVRFALHFHHTKTHKNYVLMNSWLPNESSSSKQEKEKTEETEETEEKKDDDADDGAEIVTSQSKYKEDSFKEIYDLKGCADDKMMHKNFKKLEQVHKRCWHCKFDCCADDARNSYKNSKTHARKCTFFIHFEERRKIMAKIQSDAQFLRTNGLMDYSLIVGIKKCPIAVFKEKYLPRGGFSSGVAGSDQVSIFFNVLRFF